MVYGIIITIIYLLAIGYNIYIHRTPESAALYHEKRIDDIENKNRWVHYLEIGIATILDLSLVGYTIYALTTL